MSVRNFDAGDFLDVLDGGFPNPNATPFSFVAIIRPDTVAGGDRACMGVGDASSNGVTMACNGNGGAYADDDEFEGTGAALNMTTTDWWVFAMTKGAGAGAARLHAVLLGGGSPVHSNTASVTPTSFTPDRFAFGHYVGGTAAFDGKLAVTAAFASALSDGEIEDIAAAASSAYLESLGAHEIWHWNQADVGDDVVGQLGTGADQFDISGTDVAEGVDPTWDYGLMTVTGPVTLGATNDDSARGVGNVYTHVTTAAVPAGAKVIVAVAGVAAGSPAPSYTVTGGSLSWVRDDQRAENIDTLEIWSAEAPSGLASGTSILVDQDKTMSGMMIHACYIEGQAETDYEDASAGDIRTTGGETTSTWATGTLDSTQEAVGIAIAWGDGVTAAGTSTPDDDTNELTQLVSASHEWVSALNWRKRPDAGDLAMGGTWNQDPVFADGVAAVVYRAAVVAVEGEPGRYYKRLYGPAQLAAAAADLYEVPAGGRCQIRSVDLNNPTGSEREVTFSIGDDAAGTRWLDQFTVPAGESRNLRRQINHTLTAGEKLQGFCDSAAAVVATIDGHVEQT